MKLFECRRYTGKEEREEGLSWRGALLIAADSEEEAGRIFIKREDGDEPRQIVVFAGIEVGGNPRVIYNDDCR